MSVLSNPKNSVQNSLANCGPRSDRSMEQSPCDRNTVRMKTTAKSRAVAALSMGSIQTLRVRRSVKQTIALCPLRVRGNSERMSSDTTLKRDTGIGIGVGIPRVFELYDLFL